MVLVRTIILNLCLLIYSATSLDVINLKVRNRKVTLLTADPIIWLTENQPFNLHIESDMKLKSIWCKLLHDLGITVEFQNSLKKSRYVYSTNEIRTTSPPRHTVTASMDMQGEWTCYVYYKDEVTPPMIKIVINVRVDVNECNAIPSPCSSNANCTNTLGSYNCTCLSGYDSLYCQDVDECEGPWPCSHNASCTNTLGSFECTCRTGYTGDGKYCQNVDECNAFPCSPNAKYSNTFGSCECTCLTGYEGNGTYCQASTKQKGNNLKLVVVIVVSVVVVAAVVWLMVCLYKRRQRREKALKSEINHAPLQNNTERPIPTPALCETYSVPVDRQNENDTDTYSVPYLERNIEEMYAKPQPKGLRRPPNELLYAELTYASDEQKGENSTNGNL